MAVLRAQDSHRARERGLVEVAVMRGARKESLTLEDARHLLFDLASDPGERADLDGGATGLSAELLAWRDRIETGLAAAPNEPADLDTESAAKLQSLEYLE